jgi:D-arabinono-1,4-lactone oxidase
MLPSGNHLQSTSLVSFANTNSHGAGIKHQTLSDLVYAMEYVDAHGQFQTIKPEDKDLLKAAGGCFGLIGVVTHLVLKLDPMSYAIVEPRKVDVVDAIPPPRDMRERVPKALRKDRTEEEIDAAQKRFEEQAQYYYSEWFWFPYSDQIWINCWQNEQIAEGDDGKDVEQYPPKAKIVKQWFEGVAIEALQNLAKDTATEDFLPMLRTSLVSRLAMSSLPGEGTVKAWLPDALHFRRAIQNTRVRDLEVEIPLPHLANDESKPDFSIIQRAWWDAIISAYEHGDTCPQRMPLELRITGDSEATVAPFRYNKLGTASIEILTLQSVADIWPAYAQEVLDKWMALRDWNGQKLNIRPHWAKEW